jgi:hypothetical protein
MPVSRKTLQIFICAAATAALATFGTLAQATFYGGDFDPPDPTGHFFGHFIVNDVNDHCLSHTTGCEIDLISLLITASDHFCCGEVSGFQANIASSESVSFVGGLHFSSVDIPLHFTDFVSTGLGSLAAPVFCNPCVMFTTEFGKDFLNLDGHQGYLANLHSDTVTDNAIYTAARIPEPGSLGLLVGGIGAAWLTRRRKTRA